MPRKAKRTRRELLWAETGTVRKDWRGKISVAVTYPNTYHLGMSNLGFQTVYSLVNGFDDVVCERAFLSKEKGKGQGHVRSLESGRYLTDFDIIAFSISFENDYANLLTVLAGAGIPLRSSERRAPHPLIIAGGVTTFLNPEPIALFVDCFLIGEAEEILPHFFRVYRECSRREALLEALSRRVSGAYVPAFYDVDYKPDGTIGAFRPKGDFPLKITPPKAKDLSSCDVCTTILTPHTTFNDMYLIEAARGCPHGCRFCAAGFVYRPPRFRTATQLEESLERAAAGTKRVGLMASAVSDIPWLEGFCRRARDLDLQLSFSSLRADLLTPEFLKSLEEAGVKTATIAPDGGSERMRRMINKGVDEEDVLKATELLVRTGIPNLRLYFMVGLPEETMTDIEGIVNLCKKIKHRFLKMSREKARIGQIIVSLSSFVPKPFTPFQWVPMDDVKDLKAKIRHVTKGLRRVANVKVHADLPKWAYIQALLSRGDRRTAELLEGVHR
ncbi:MAG: radical SAM protein, partial [Thermodesulfobacteriota bacterium]|nr:radical SAM protein [Thermodesulfobacteriota bacterium]